MRSSYGKLTRSGGRTAGLFVFLVFLPSCGSAESPASPARAQEEDDGLPFEGTLPGSGETSCVTLVSEAEALPFDLYVLFDQSGSMSAAEGAGSRLDAVRAAMADFLRDEESSGMGLGIGYFGNFPIGSASCDPADYEEPAVPIALLPQNANRVLGSLASVRPTGETPTGAALRGACTYAESWRDAHPGRSLDLLLLTDGVPEAPVSRSSGCDPTLEDAALAASDCAGRAGVNTFVLGVGPNLDGLERIAAAGGTEHALLVEGGDVTREVGAALGRIRGTALPCSLRLPEPPPGQTFDRARVNVVVTDAAGKDHALSSVTSADDCAAGGGWYYGAGAVTDRIELCPTSCDFAKAQSNDGRIRFALGCRTLTTTR